MEGIGDQLKQQVGVVADGANQEQHGQQESEHDGVFGQSLALFGAEKFSTEVANKRFLH